MNCPLSDLNAHLRPLLEELMASDLERRPFVIVEDTLTRRFVQYARRYKPKTGALLFDAPLLGIELRACPDMPTACDWAVKAFRNDFALPWSAELRLTIDGEPAS